MISRTRHKYFVDTHVDVQELSKASMRVSSGGKAGERGRDGTVDIYCNVRLSTFLSLFHLPFIP